MIQLSSVRVLGGSILLVKTGFKISVCGGCGGITLGKCTWGDREGGCIGLRL